MSCGVPDGCDHQLQVAVIEAGDGVAEGDGGSVGDAGGELEDAPFPAGQGLPGGDRGVPVDPAIGVMPSLMLVLAWMKPAKSWRSRNPPWLRSSSVPASAGYRPAALARSAAGSAAVTSPARARECRRLLARWPWSRAAAGMR